MLSKYSIRAKIITTVAFLLLALIGVGIFAILQLRAINANAVDIETNWLPSVRTLGELRASAITYRIVVRDYGLYIAPKGTPSGATTLTDFLRDGAKAEPQK